jgi:hypothetical protein
MTFTRITDTSTICSNTCNYHSIDVQLSCNIQQTLKAATQQRSKSSSHLQTYHGASQPPQWHQESSSPSRAQRPQLHALSSGAQPVRLPYRPYSNPSLTFYPALAPALSRTYAVNPSSSSASKNNSNASNPQASSAESQDINASAATRGMKDQDTASVANPVSHPEDGAMGATEETTQSQDAMKHDPKESDASKREKTLSYGQNKPLDAADK